jgi:membrane protease YdiL (CAAX protease family)
MGLTIAGIDPFALISAPVPETHVHLFLFTAIILGPITEELFFRGFLYSFLRPSGILSAVIISTGMFALSHYSGNGFPFIQVIGGLLFAVSFEYTRNLVTPMTIHLLGNLFIYLTG